MVLMYMIRGCGFHGLSCWFSQFSSMTFMICGCEFHDFRFDFWWFVLLIVMICGFCAHDLWSGFPLFSELIFMIRFARARSWNDGPQLARRQQDRVSRRPGCKSLNSFSMTKFILQNVTFAPRITAICLTCWQSIVRYAYAYVVRCAYGDAYVYAYVHVYSYVLAFVFVCVYAWLYVHAHVYVYLCSFT